MSNAIASDFLDHSSLCVRNDSTRTKNREGWVGSLVEGALVLGLGEHDLKKYLKIFLLTLTLLST